MLNRSAAWIHAGAFMEGRRMGQVKTSRVALAAIAAALVMGIASQASAQQTGKLQVTVDYKGAGTVDKTHQIFVWVFDTPDINENSVPIATDQAHVERRHAFILGTSEDRLPRRGLQREGHLRRHAGPAALGHACDHLRRDGHRQRGSNRRRRREGAPSRSTTRCECPDEGRKDEGREDEGPGTKRRGDSHLRPSFPRPSS